MTGVEFWRAVTANGRARCLGCEVWSGDRGRCEYMSAGLLDAHHVLPKQVLKREFPFGGRLRVREHGEPVLPWEASPRGWEPDLGWDTITLAEIVWDPRDGVPLRRYHHDAVEHGQLHIPRVVLPDAVENFASELGLTWLLDRTYGVKEAVA